MDFDKVPSSDRIEIRDDNSDDQNNENENKDN